MRAAGQPPGTRFATIEMAPSNADLFRTRRTLNSMESRGAPQGS